MRSSHPEVFFAGPALLGEGPVYDATTDELLWVDIEARRAHRQSLSAREPQRLDLGQPVGAVVLRQRGGYGFALRDGLAVSDTWGGPLRFVTATQRDQPDHRMNDGKCDARGRFWVGAMAIDMRPHEGTLFRIDADYQEYAIVTGFTVPNGMCWSADEKQMYYIDSKLQRVDVFDYEAESGALSRQRTLFDIPASAGAPDGMTIDDSGCLWVAHFDGGAVRRYTPAGAVDRTIQLPASRVTSCTFGGSRHDQLFITTSSFELSPEARAREPLAGAVFVARTDCRGFPPHRYGG